MLVCFYTCKITYSEKQLPSTYQHLQKTEDTINMSIESSRRKWDKHFWSN